MRRKNMRCNVNGEDGTGGELEGRCNWSHASIQ